MTNFRNALRDFVWREDGAALVEYALLLVLIAIAIILGAAFLGQSISKMFDSASTTIGNA
ncbi:MAG: Flp family type IVb pilin [Gemmatimonadales bacterium]